MTFGWWDKGVYHYVKRTPGERYYGLGERAGAMDRAGRRFRLTNLDPMGYDAAADDPLYMLDPLCAGRRRRGRGARGLL
ncbi:hypothetical protein ACRAWD_29980 [Caulobacter segnis]